MCLTLVSGADANILLHVKIQTAQTHIGKSNEGWSASVVRTIALKIHSTGSNNVREGCCKIRR